MTSNLQQLWSEGGVVLYLLVGMSILGHGVIFWKLIWQIDFYWHRQQHLVAFQQFFRRYEGIPMPVQDKLQLSLEHYFAPTYLGMQTIKIISGVAPLLGLLGTVLGIYSTFQNMSQSSLPQTASLAGGISYALITTIAGLIVAIPHFVAYHYLLGMLTRAQMKLEELFCAPGKGLH